MTHNSTDLAAQTAQVEAPNEQPEMKKVAIDKKLQNSDTYDRYDKAMGELSDADSAASAGGPAI